MSKNHGTKKQRAARARAKAEGTHFTTALRQVEGAQHGTAVTRRPRDVIEERIARLGMTREGAIESVLADIESGILVLNDNFSITIPTPTSTVQQNAIRAAAIDALVASLSQVTDEEWAPVVRAFWHVDGRAVIDAVIETSAEALRATPDFITFERALWDVSRRVRTDRGFDSTAFRFVEECTLLAIFARELISAEDYETLLSPLHELGGSLDPNDHDLSLRTSAGDDPTKAARDADAGCVIGVDSDGLPISHDLEADGHLLIVGRDKMLRALSERIRRLLPSGARALHVSLGCTADANIPRYMVDAISHSSYVSASEHLNSLYDELMEGRTRGCFEHCTVFLQGEVPMSESEALGGQFVSSFEVFGAVIEAVGRLMSLPEQVTVIWCTSRTPKADDTISAEHFSSVIALNDADNDPRKWVTGLPERGRFDATVPGTGWLLRRDKPLTEVQFASR